MFRINQTTTIAEKLSAMFSLNEYQTVPAFQASSSHVTQRGSALGLSAAGRRRRRRLSKFGSAPNAIKSTWF